MANTYIQIGSTVTVGSGGASSISFSSIPSTYTDLVVRFSLRSATTGSAIDYINMWLNGSDASFNSKWIFGNGSTTSSGSRTDNAVSATNNPGTWTSNTFSNGEIRFPNYTDSKNKIWHIDTVTENWGTAYMETVSGMWSNTSAITSISLFGGGSTNFVQYSTASLYGIKSS
jgi:hypothetical protein